MGKATVEWKEKERRRVTYHDLELGEWFVWIEADNSLALKVEAGFNYMDGRFYGHDGYAADEVIRIRVNIQCEEE